MHWAFQYIGRPWVEGARGPDAFDCWGLLAFVLQTHYQVTIPSRPLIATDDDYEVARMMTGNEKKETTHWKILEQPVDGCAVSMTGVSGTRLHVGIYLDVDGGKVLHCAQGKGVLAQSLLDLRVRSHAHNIRFYQFRG